MKQDRIDTINRIINRAEALGIGIGNRCTRFMDITNADKQFNLRLDEWLAAGDFDFAHDFTGIQANINRQTCKVENLFVPRFATSKATKTAQMEFIAQDITKLANRFISDPIEITYRRETKESVNDFTEWARHRHGILSGDEYFYVWRGELLYAVNVSADSPLTAAEELMRLLAAKF